MSNKKFGVIGNQGITIKCIEHMSKHEGVNIVFVIFDPDRQNPGSSVEDYCKKQGITCFGMSEINTPECIELIKKSDPDIIFSISNYWVMKKELLSTPKNGVINFHNGPPSSYRGLNIPSWVVINGEKTHGVMWHFADEGIDSGDVVGYEMFDIEKQETASTLMVKCINKGIDLFKRILPDILDNKIQRFPQETKASCYSSKDFPEKNGVIDFQWSFEKIDRMVRGLNYLPFLNPYCHAKMRNEHGEVIVNEILREGDLAPGTKAAELIEVSDDKFLIACSDSVINIKSSMDEDHRDLSSVELAQKLGVDAGCFLKSIP